MSDDGVKYAKLSGYLFGVMQAVELVLLRERAPGSAASHQEDIETALYMLEKARNEYVSKVYGISLTNLEDE